MTKEKTIEVAGYSLELEGGRKVFVSSRAGDGTYSFVFTNREGEETRLRLSAEATQALVDLIFAVRPLA